MRSIVKSAFAARLAITCVVWFGAVSMGFQATDAYADDGGHEKYENQHINPETMAQLDMATKFNVEVEDIDCEDVFSKPSFGKAYHKSGSVQDYCGALKPDALPYYQVRRTDYQDGSEPPGWSTGAIGILCSVLLVIVLILWGVRVFFRNDLKTHFNNCNGV